MRKLIAALVLLLVALFGAAPAFGQETPTSEIITVSSTDPAKYGFDFDERGNALGGATVLDWLIERDWRVIGSHKMASRNSKRFILEEYGFAAKFNGGEGLFVWVDKAKIAELSQADDLVVKKMASGKKFDAACEKLGLEPAFSVNGPLPLSKQGVWVYRGSKRIIQIVPVKSGRHWELYFLAAPRERLLRENSRPFKDGQGECKSFAHLVEMCSGYEHFSIEKGDEPIKFVVKGMLRDGGSTPIALGVVRANGEIKISEMPVENPESISDIKAFEADPAFEDVKALEKKVEHSWTFKATHLGSDRYTWARWSKFRRGGIAFFVHADSDGVVHVLLWKRGMDPTIMNR